jgi:hypothetical protein
LIYISDLVLVSHLASDSAKAGKEGFNIFFVVVECEGSSGRGHDAKELVQRLCAVMASSDCDVLAGENLSDVMGMYAVDSEGYNSMMIVRIFGA